jgi:RNA polymerase sigma factor (sigma-70 family)
MVTGAFNISSAVTSSRFGSIGGLEMTAPLEVEEERRLHPVIQAGRRAVARLEGNLVDSASERRTLQRQRHAGQTAESLLLQSTLGLVRARVTERGYRFGNEELEAAGVEGLVNALHRFDPEKGTRFSTYANYWIMKLVNQAIQQQAGLTDSEMRLVLAVQKLARSNPNKELTKREIATSLGVTLVKAQEVLQLSRELQSRRYETTDLSDASHVKLRSDSTDAPPWVLEALHRLCGNDFDAFWQFTFKTMSVDEIAKAHGITRQGMTKRIERCRRAVRESPEAQRLEEWFDRQ